MPKELHGCSIDYQGNIWIAGHFDGIVQKYTHDGSKMLLQIGIKGKYDSADGTDSTAISGTASRAMNSIALMTRNLPRPRPTYFMG